MTKDQVRNLISSSADNMIDRDGYAYCAGYLSSVVAELMSRLPEAERNNLMSIYFNPSVKGILTNK
jgi:hypothetical protein